MSRKFITTIIAASVALTTLGSAPVRADEDLNRALAAILGVAIVGKIIHERKKDKRDRHVVTRNESNLSVNPYRSEHVQPRPRHVQPRHVQPRPRHIQPRHVQPRSYIQPRPLPDRINKRILPAHCFRTFKTRRGTYRGFGQRCLTNNYRYVNSLPQNCRIRVRTDRGPRNAFEARCLRNAGYRLARS